MDLGQWLMALTAGVGSAATTLLVGYRFVPRAISKQVEATLVAAREQAQAVIEGGQKQSLETERMKLRYDTLRRRRERFDRALMELLDATLGRAGASAPLPTAADLRLLYQRAVLCVPTFTGGGREMAPSMETAMDELVAALEEFLDAVRSAATGEDDSATRRLHTASDNLNQSLCSMQRTAEDLVDREIQTWA